MKGEVAEVASNAVEGVERGGVMEGRGGNGRGMGDDRGGRGGGRRPNEACHRAPMA